MGGKNKGDRYRIKDDVVTMVHRHIHGSLINIYTKEIKETGHGYLSARYTSQYFDPLTKQPNSGKCIFEDTFIPLLNERHWVLESRSIEKDEYNGIESEIEKFAFSDFKLNDN